MIEGPPTTSTPDPLAEVHAEMARMEQAVKDAESALHAETDAQEPEAPVAPVVPPVPPRPDHFEWIQRGDGAHVLFKNGQISGDPADVALAPPIR